jgi:hypothetical protein
VVGGLIALIRRHFEAFDTVAYSFAKFETLLGPKHEHGNSIDQQQAHGLKKSFKRKFLPKV